MNSPYAFRVDLGLLKTRNYRRAARRRGRIILALASLALAAGVAGAMIHTSDGPPRLGPFSYIPSQ